MKNEMVQQHYCMPAANAAPQCTACWATPHFKYRTAPHFKFRISKTANRMPHRECRILNTASGTPRHECRTSSAAQCSISSAAPRVPQPECRIPSAAFRMPHERRILSAAFRMRPEHRILNAASSMQHPGCRNSRLLERRSESATHCGSRATVFEMRHRECRVAESDELVASSIRECRY